jgi:hypothetical protein
VKAIRQRNSNAALTLCFNIAPAASQIVMCICSCNAYGLGDVVLHALLPRSLLGCLGRNSAFHQRICCIVASGLFVKLLRWSPILLVLIRSLWWWSVSRLHDTSSKLLARGSAAKVSKICIELTLLPAWVDAGWSRGKIRASRVSLTPTLTPVANPRQQRLARPA